MHTLWEFSTGLVIGFMLSGLLFLLMHRTNYRNLVKLPVVIQELKDTRKELDKSKAEFQTMMRDVNHGYLRPNLATLEGLLLLIKKDNHYRYAELALIEVENLKNKIDSFFKKYEKYQ